jgi:hypothetical protein
MRDKIQILLLYICAVLCRKYRESEKTLEKQLHLVYGIADFISYLVKTGDNAAG